MFQKECMDNFFTSVSLVLDIEIFAGLREGPHPWRIPFRLACEFSWRGCYAAFLPNLCQGQPLSHSFRIKRPCCWGKHHFLSPLSLLVTRDF
ncbi:hypothetical protein TNIN_152761 [Trichonephila inaurata madagascariensis]|uniref:Uncharacterized protein n=1 Tax=Trichonephila inaurata madagascariensis TaxID=2747483 RepID=A0A8X6IKR2_9ARAC|nr:hypothetical protein TNIN_152761 [Trichonephila inaurata madagascariensis]